MKNDDRLICLRLTKTASHQLLNQMNWNVMDQTFIEFDLLWITTISRIIYLQFSDIIFVDTETVCTDCVYIWLERQ